MNAVEHDGHQDVMELERRLLTPDQAWQKLTTLCELTPTETVPATAAEYLNNLRYSWIFRVLFYRGPHTDDRQATRTELNAILTSGKTHPPHKHLNLVAAGESTSWNFVLRPELAATWHQLRTFILEIISTATTKETLNQHLDQVANDVENHFFSSLESFLQKYGISADRIALAGSGAQAILWALGLLKPGYGIVTTSENGGEVQTAAKENNLPPIAVRFDAPTETNVPRSHQEVAKEYLNYIQNGERAISFTVCSKTGMRFDIRPTESEPSALEIVLDAVRRHNENPANQNDQIALILDVVQLAGRELLSEMLAYLTEPQIAGIVFTGSKHSGGCAHAGFFIANPQLNLQDYTHNLNPVEQQQRQMMYVPGFTPPQPDVLALLRGIDNLQALADADELRNHPEYHAALTFCETTYKTIFAKLGFRILFSQTPTIIPLEAPIDLEYLPEEIDTEFLTQSADQGIAFGGFLKEGNEPILRFGIPSRLLKLLVDDPMGQKAVEREFQIFEKTLAQVLHR